MKYEGSTLLDNTHWFVYPLVSRRLSMRLWRRVMKMRIRKGGKYARTALDILYLLQR